MKDQDLYTERCAKAEAEKAAKAKAEQERARKERERQERARREQEERNRRYNQQNRSNNRSSSGGSSRNYSGSWNNADNSYFKGCSTKADLKRRYRQLCKKLHPDCPGGNAESFKIMIAEYNRMCAQIAG